MEFRRPNHVSGEPASYTSAAPAEPAAAPAHEVHKSKKRTSGLKKPQGKMLLWAAMVILLVAAVGTATYYINRYYDSQQQVKNLSNNPQEVARIQVNDAVAKIGRLVELPPNETPTLATVTDPTKLKDQAFFANSKTGDLVLIYTQAKQAILYRPSTNKIIAIAPVNIGNNQTPAKTTP